MKISSLCSTDGCVGVDVITSSLSESGTCVGAQAVKSSLSESGTCVGASAVTKASLSAGNGDCVGAQAKSSSCNGGNCVGAQVITSSLSNSFSNCVAAEAVTAPCDAGTCVGAEAVTSSLSTYNGNCVRVCASGAWEHRVATGDLSTCETLIAITDTKVPDAPPVLMTPDAYTGFINRVKAGEFPPSEGAEEYQIGHHAYNREEWRCFVEGTKLPCDCGCGLDEFDLNPSLVSVPA